MKRTILIVFGLMGAVWAGTALGQGGFVHPGGNVTGSNGTNGHIHPGGAVTFSDGTTGFVHPGGSVTTSDGRAGFLHPGGTLTLPPKAQRMENPNPQVGEPVQVPVAKEKPRKSRSRAEPQKEYVWERIPDTNKAPAQSKKAKFIEIHSDGTVTESYH